MAGSSMFWHVPAWFNGRPTDTDFAFVAGDVVIPLLETESASESIAPDNYWVERIVGQYLFTANITPGALQPAFLHSRVYVMPADQTGVDTRLIHEEDDADTSFLMHKVEYFDEGINGVVEGTWQNTDALTLKPPISRSGGFDIKVGRKVSAGEALIWHSHIVSSILGTSDIKMWCRVLLRQLG